MATIPSIAMIPSGVKASKLYSVLPTDGTGDFTTTRASVATRVNENGLIEEVAANVPRLDYSDGSCPSLLLEPTATNLIPYSEDFSNGAWTKGGDTVVSGGFLSPDGTNNAYKVSGTTSALTSNYNPLDSLTHSRTIYAKTVSGSGLLHLCSHNSNADSLFTITEEWQRFEVNGYNSTGSNNFYAVDFRGSSTLTEVLIWGASAEANSYATSYIKTVGTAQTRSADTATGSGNSTVINSSEGVLYFEGKSLNNTVALNRKISLGDGSFNNGVEFGYQNTTNKMQFIIRSGGVISMNIETTIFDVTEFNKIAISYKSNEGKVFVNGSQIGVTDTTVVIPIGLSQLDFNLSTSFDFEGKTKDLRVYTTALSDAELTTLTTI